jgi:signal transduction histidine kinase/ActR/RegA family two-component response regulator
LVNVTQQIIDAFPEGILLLDSQQRMLLANPVAQTYLPALVGEVREGILTHLGKQPLDKLLQPGAESVSGLEIGALKNNRIFKVTVQSIGNGGRSSGWVLLIRDVTEERERQQQMQTQDRLATVGQLAAGIAHDFNNIMSIITLYSGTLAKYPDHPNHKEYLDQIGQQAKHAARLVGQILDFSRRSVMEHSWLNLLPFTKEVVKLLQRTMPETIKFTLTAKEEQYAVRADPTRLQQVLMNLAVNARDAMSDGGELAITLARQTVEEIDPQLAGLSAGQWITLTITDTGQGIPPDFVPHIFEPFFTTKQPGKGTGLGLAQVYGIVKQHGGEIGVRSTVGQGTTFTLYLPALAKTIPEPENRQEQILSVDLKNKTILLVEDDPGTRAAIQDVLQSTGCRVLVTSTGLKALVLIGERENGIDLVITDMIMPELGGVGLYKTIAQRKLDVPLIIMTGYPLTEESRQLLEQQEVVWLQKPFTNSQLLFRVRQALVKGAVYAKA